MSDVYDSVSKSAGGLCGKNARGVHLKGQDIRRFRDRVYKKSNGDTDRG